MVCSADGKPFSKQIPHTQEEIIEILGLFWLILKSKSEPFTQEELKEFKYIALQEYSNQYGIAVKTEVKMKNNKDYPKEIK